MADRFPIETVGSRLDQCEMHLGARVLKCVGSSASSAAYVHLEKGEVVEASRGVVVAVEGPEALSLLGDSIKKCPSKTEEGVGTCCLYFRYYVEVVFP